jgi:hypothetical protein
MKVIANNGKGRTLLHVTQATSTERGTMYSYTGEGCGGFTDFSGVQIQVALAKEYAPRAAIVGELPNPLS